MKLNDKKSNIKNMSTMTFEYFYEVPNLNFDILK